MLEPLRLEYDVNQLFRTLVLSNGLNSSEETFVILVRHSIQCKVFNILLRSIKLGNAQRPMHLFSCRMVI